MILEFKYFNTFSLPQRNTTNLAHNKQFQNANLRATQVDGRGNVAI